MVADKILSVLVGLTGAISNNGKTKNTDFLVIKGLSLLKSENMAEILRVEEELRQEKFIISPNCATCKAPCGNTSDYDMSNFYSADSAIIEAKQRVIDELEKLGHRLIKDEKTELGDAVYRAISYLGFELDIESYSLVLQELKNL